MHKINYSFTNERVKITVVQALFSSYKNQHNPKDAVMHLKTKLLLIRLNKALTYLTFAVTFLFWKSDLHQC